MFWLRRDLRLADNVGLAQALRSGKPVLPVFIFDHDILRVLPKQDLRVQFILQTLLDLQQQLRELGSDLLIVQGPVLEVWRQLLDELEPAQVFCNEDYEPKAIARDKKVADLCAKAGVDFSSHKDQVVFAKGEVLSGKGTPYTVFTPYKNAWLAKLRPEHLQDAGSKALLKNLWQGSLQLAKNIRDLADLGFTAVADFQFPRRVIAARKLADYDKTRDFPAQDSTSHLGLHLRFGTLSVREAARQAVKINKIWLSELIWREFFMQILFHFPFVENKSFRPDFEKVPWRNNKKEFQSWCEGRTGVPLVDAGMRELNATGFMHNRVRMVVGSYLTKHLLMHWHLGERYFAEKLLDYDLAANCGNWQWVAGSGCDAAPYFRVFNPDIQTEKFDPDHIYIKKWVPEFGTSKCNPPIVGHAEGRDRALRTFALTFKSKPKVAKEKAK